MCRAIKTASGLLCDIGATRFPLWYQSEHLVPPAPPSNPVGSACTGCPSLVCVAKLCGLRLGASSWKRARRLQLTWLAVNAVRNNWLRICLGGWGMVAGSKHGLSSGLRSFRHSH